MAHPTKGDLEAAMLRLGQPGRFSVLVFLLLCFNYFPVAFNHLLMSVYGATPPHRCATPGGAVLNQTVPVDEKGQYDRCQVYVNYTPADPGPLTKCPNGYVYFQEEGESTIVNEWDLVCDQRYLVGLATSIYFAGVMVGGIVFGSLSDKIGRKPVMLLTLYSPVLFGVMLFFVENFILFVIIRFIIGFFMQGLQLGTFVLMTEFFVGDRHRAYVSGVIETFWGAAVMSLAGVAYLFKDWRYMQLAVSIPSVIAVFYICFIPESIRWLFMQKRYEEAEQVLQRAARFNKVTLPDDPLKRKQSNDSPVIEEEEDSVPVYSILDLVRTPRLRIRTIIMAYVWLSTSVSYYGLSLNASKLAGNKYLNYFINGAVEFPIYPAGIFILSRFGRRKPLSVYFMIGGAACLASGLIPKVTETGGDISWLPTALAWIGKASMAGSFSVLFLYASEVYPTVVRNIGVGACAFWARVGSVIAPQINTLGDYTYSWLPSVIFGSAALIGGVLALFLPETLNRKLPDTIPEAEGMTMSTDDNAQEKTNGVIERTMHNGIANDGMVTEDITQL